MPVVSFPSTETTHFMATSYLRRAKMSDSASSRVVWLVLSVPRTADVVVREPGFLTPRMLMQRCSASRTTMTP